MTFGEELRKARKSLGLSQAELSGRVGVSNTYVSALESGKKTAPPYALVRALAAVLQIPEERLWSAARAEREARLRVRISGDPTSLRIPKPNADENARYDYESTTNRSLRALEAQLGAIIKKSSDKNGIIKVLEAVLRALAEDE